MRRCVMALCLLVMPIAGSAQVPTLGMNAPRLYENGMNALTGVGDSHNDLKALDSFRRAGDLGYAPAQTVLGYFYETGTIVTSQPGQALDWYKKAATQGDRVGDWLLGRLYFSGTGTQRDLNAAEQWLQNAANQGDPYGQYLLGRVKLERNDYVNAAVLFRKAAMQGLPQAQQQLGQLLKQGRGVNVDKFEAYVWLLVSYDAGNQAVAGDLQVLEGDLGSTKTEEAKSKARDLEQNATRAVTARGCTGWPGEFNEIPAPPPPDIQRFCR